MSESELDQAMARYAAGEDDAFAVIHAGLHTRLRAFLKRMVGSSELAEELAQETFLRMHRARGSFSPGSPVVPWAYAIARNCFLDHHRYRKSRPRPTASVGSSEDDAPVHDPAAGPDASGEQQAIARETARVVQKALDEMTPTRREAFVLLRYEGLSVARAAEVLGVSKNAVKLRAFHAYEDIRAALAQLEARGGAK